ncbi:hypothetical protein BROUX41_006785 [Berkeleyomyces rouxiae]
MRFSKLVCPRGAHCRSVVATTPASPVPALPPRNRLLANAPAARSFSHYTHLLDGSRAPSAVQDPPPPPVSAKIPPVSTPAFTPRTSFDAPDVRKSYFLGHHRSALRNIESRLSDTGLVVECRDIRLPLTSWNPMLERVLANASHRVVVYTKCDLITQSPHNGNIQAMLGRFHASRPGSGKPIFLRKGTPPATLLATLRDAAAHSESLTGLRAFVVGMPNVGKSSLINRLRTYGMGGGRPKVAATADYPGVTRSLSMPVRILGGKDRPQDNVAGEGIFMVDTPGVFMPYVADPETMLKLALTHGIRDGIVPYEIQADYLLYKMNQWDPTLYAHFCPPTNDAMQLLGAVATKTGRLSRAAPGHEHHAAAWLVGQWRAGKIAKYPLEDVTPDAIQAAIAENENPAISLTQAKKLAKEAKKEAMAAKRKARG